MLRSVRCEIVFEDVGELEIEGRLDDIRRVQKLLSDGRVRQFGEKVVDVEQLQVVLLFERLKQSLQVDAYLGQLVMEVGKGEMIAGLRMNGQLLDGGNEFSEVGVANEREKACFDHGHDEIELMGENEIVDDGI